MIENCGNCRWWVIVHNHRGNCGWPIPKIPRIAELVRNVAWEKEEDCPVWEGKDERIFIGDSVYEKF